MTPGLSKNIRCHVWPYFLLTYKSLDQTSDHTWSGLLAWWLHLVILIFLRGLCGNIWVNILILLPLRVVKFEFMTLLEIQAYCHIWCKLLYSKHIPVITAKSPHDFHFGYCNQQILAAIKFGVSQNKVIWRLLNLASSRRPSMQCTIDVYIGGDKY